MKELKILIAEDLPADAEIARRSLMKEKISFTYQFVQNINEGLMQVDNDDRILFVNKELCEMFGYTEDELIGKIGYKTIIHEEDQETLKQKNRSRPKKPHEKYEIKGKKKNGDVIWLSVSGSAVKDEDDNVIGSVGLLTNITERRLAEEKLRESERQNAFLVETSFEMLELNSIQEIYEYTTRKISNYLEDNSVVCVVEFNYDTNRWKMKHIEGIRDKIDQLTKLFGYDLSQLEGDISTKYFGKITTGKLAEIDFDFPGLFNNKISSEIGEAVKKMLSIDKMYCIAFQEDNRIYGNITFLTTGKSKPFNSELIEAFVNQVANFVKRHKSEAALHERTELLQNITNHMFDMVAMTDLTGVFTYAGPSHRILGYEPEQLIGTNVIEYVHPDDASFIAEEFKEFIAHPSPDTTRIVEYRQRCRDGSYIWLETMGKILFNNNGHPHTLFFSSRNVTERKQAEEALRESEAQYRLLAENSGDVIFTLDFDLNYTYISPAIYTLRGYRPEEIINRNISRTITPLSGIKVKQLFEKYIPSIKNGNASAEPLIVELEVLKKDGSTIWVEIKLSILTDSIGKPIGILGVSRDISKRKAMQEQLVEAKEKAEAADRLKTAFLNNISHEVRTPLNGILGFGQMMTEADLPQETKKKYFKILKQSSDRLINTITSFMDISLLVSGNMEVRIKRFSLSYLLTNLYEMFSGSFKGKGLGLELKSDGGNLDIGMESDEEILKKIFYHLIGNALKFTKEGAVQFGFRQKDDAIEFFVEDTGVGIDGEMLESVFGHFVQEDTRIARGYEGSGLGLSISKGLVELLGGTITLDSIKGRGTRVIFSIPTRIFPVTEESSEENQNFPASPLILIAEDDSMNALYVETVLAKAGYETLIVTDGNQAVEKCKENAEIGLVLMDIKMPVMDGLEATRQIKSFKPGLPIIATTAQAMKGDEKLALDAGCDEYLSKPFRHEDLVQKIKKYLEIF